MIDTLFEDTEETIESLFDLPGDEPSTEVERRLQNLEEKVRGHIRRMDEDILSRVQILEDLLNFQMVCTRKEIALEATERREQFAELAQKLSRSLDRLQAAAGR